MLHEKDTSFYTMFGGKWEIKYDPKNGAVFIDRDPDMFGYILSYMRIGEIDLTELTPAQRFKLERKAGFYQISSLARLFLVFHRNAWQSKAQQQQQYCYQQADWRFFRGELAPFRSPQLAWRRR